MPRMVVGVKVEKGNEDNFSVNRRFDNLQCIEKEAIVYFCKGVSKIYFKKLVVPLDKGGLDIVTLTIIDD